MTEAKASQTKQIFEKYVLTFSELKFVPAPLKPHFIKAAPFVGKAAESIENFIPILIQFYKKLQELWIILEPYKLEILLPSLIGLIMCFFGGSYLTLIAAVEAYKMVGYESSLKCISDLVEDFKKVVEANKKDDATDVNGDGVSDVLQADSQQIVVRKTLLFLKTVDPNRFTNAISVLTSGFLAVSATLKIQFAKAITLGHAIGEVVEKPVFKYILPTVEQALPNDYKKWAKPFLSYTVKSIAVSIAWIVQRVMSAFHSAIRGGLMFSRNILHYLSVMKVVEINENETYLDEAVGYAVALIGFFFQLKFGFGVPFPLNIVLLPFTILEYLLMWMVNTK